MYGLPQEPKYLSGSSAGPTDPNAEIFSIVKLFIITHPSSPLVWLPGYMYSKWYKSSKLHVFKMGHFFRAICIQNGTSLQSYMYSCIQNGTLLPGYNSKWYKSSKLRVHVFKMGHFFQVICIQNGTSLQSYMYSKWESKIQAICIQNDRSLPHYMYSKWCKVLIWHFLNWH